MRVSINMSIGELRDPALAGVLRGELEAASLPADALAVEVLEDVLLDRSADAVLTTLSELARVGVGLALDDFGTGYASLTHLKLLPL